MKRLLLLLILSACSSTAITETTTTTPTTTSTSVITTTSTTTTSTTTTTVARTGYCPQWHELALSVGWPEEELPTLDKVMWRESRCTPDVYSNSNYGLTQINQIHQDWVRELGWNYPDDLYDPAKNLYLAYLLWADDGWKHWKTSR